MLIALIGVGGAGAGLGAGLAVGIASDEPFVTNDGGSSYYGALRAMGMSTSRLVVVWHPESPTTIYDRGELDRVIPTAQGDGVQPFFNVTQSVPSALSSTDNRSEFAAFLQILATAYPQVTQYVVGNEPNVTYFWRPQFNDGGSARSPGDFVDLLARSYDALKAVNPNIEVTAGGLDARGNDSPAAPSNISISPTRFIAAMGQAYRASGRTRPLFDAVSFHPYPQSAKDPYTGATPGRTPASPTSTGSSRRTGTPSRAPRNRPSRTASASISTRQAGRRRRPADHAAAYSGTEVNEAIDEPTQAQIYGDVIRYLACDPSVQDVLFYRLLDESDLARWQSGLYRADGTPKPAADAVRQAVAEPAAAVPASRGSSNIPRP